MCEIDSQLFSLVIHVARPTCTERCRQVASWSWLSFTLAVLKRIYAFEHLQYWFNDLSFIYNSRRPSHHCLGAIGFQVACIMSNFHYPSSPISVSIVQTKSPPFGMLLLSYRQYRGFDCVNQSQWLIFDKGSSINRKGAVLRGRGSWDRVSHTRKRGRVYKAPSLYTVQQSLRHRRQSTVESLLCHQPFLSLIRGSSKSNWTSCADKFPSTDWFDDLCPPLENQLSAPL